MLLAVDSSSGTSVALLDDAGEVAATARSDDPRGHAEAIGPLLRRVLGAASGGTVTAVAYGVGPGPYTGLRVGMAAARMAALALGAVELPVLSHDAVALAAAEGGAALPFVVVADAKRHERFHTLYRTLDLAGTPVRAAEPAVVRIEQVPDLPVVELPVDAAALGLVALRRRAAGLPPERRAARYLRSPDVTLAVPRRVGP